VDILVQLVQVGGIGGSLAFLLLGYYLLSKEQDKRDGQNNPVPPSQQIIDAIYRFLRYALVFFAVGTAVQIGMTVMQDQLRRWGQSDVAQLIFDRWYFDRPNSRAIVSFSEAAFSDSPVVDSPGQVRRLRRAPDATVHQTSDRRISHSHRSLRLRLDRKPTEACHGRTGRANR